MYACMYACAHMYVYVHVFGNHESSHNYVCSDSNGKESLHLIAT